MSSLFQSVPSRTRADRLGGLVRTLVANPDPPMVAGIEQLDGDTGVLHVKTLEPSDPVVDLFGLVAPDSWDGLAVTARGHSLLTPTDVVLAVAFTRRGEAVIAFTPEDSETPRVDHTRTHELSGHVPDALRRALGMPNPPPERPLVELLSLQWLDRLAGQSTKEPGRLGWADVVGLHPAVATLDEVVSGDHQVARSLGTDDIIGLAEDHLVMIGRSFAQQGSWQRLRSAYADYESVKPDTVDWSDPPLGLTPEAAAWMDDGMFSRWVLGGYPPLDDLRAIANETLPITVARRVDATLAAWGLSADTAPAAS